MRVSDLTAGERLFLERRRGGQSQVEAAEQHGTSRYQYRNWELDLEDGAPKPKLGKVEEHEKYVILRRRKGMTVKLLAQKLGCCPYWVQLMEAGERPADRLKKFWKQ